MEMEGSQAGKATKSQREDLCIAARCPSNQYFLSEAASFTLALTPISCATQPPPIRARPPILSRRYITRPALLLPNPFVPYGILSYPLVSLKSDMHGASACVVHCASRAVLLPPSANAHPSSFAVIFPFSMHVILPASFTREQALRSFPARLPCAYRDVASRTSASPSPYSKTRRTERRTRRPPAAYRTVKEHAYHTSPLSGPLHMSAAPPRSHGAVERCTPIQPGSRCASRIGGCRASARPKVCALLPSMHLPACTHCPVAVIFAPTMSAPSRARGSSLYANFCTPSLMSLRTVLCLPTDPLASFTLSSASFSCPASPLHCTSALGSASLRRPCA
ncbi:hypothetical protein C8R47DRAFT_216140 [Mycena vitilis]|nr:hypothetical protein C8R47DRAFT_216140 [Mycena vitilis]